MVGSQANTPVNTNNNSSQSTHVNIGKVSVNTKATDANGISKDLHTALQNNAKGYNAIRGGK